MKMKTICTKQKCLKAVNPDHPEYGYFGVAFEYDPNWLGCRQCNNDPVEAFGPSPAAECAVEVKTLQAVRRFTRGV